MMPNTTPDYDGRISVVVPVRNEADNVLPLACEICAALDGVAEYEVIFVDDASQDATWARLQEARGALPRVRALRHRTHCGQSTAVATAVRAARYPWIATVDGDGQNDPADIPRVLQVVSAGQREPGVELAIGWRVQRRDTPLRRVSSRVANRVRATLLRDGTPDTGCGLKVFGRQAYLDLPFFDHQHRFMPALFQRQGGRVVSVPVNHRPRLRGTSKYGTLDRLWVGIVDILGVMWLIRRMKHPAVDT